MSVLRTLLELFALWLAANLLHWLWISVRLRQWEKGFVRDDHGLRPGTAPYTVGAGPVAVLWIHGFADSPTVFRRMTGRLAETGRFTCRAMRFPGAGEPVRAAAHVTLADWNTSVRGEIDALRSNHAQVWVAGHSLGASLALRAAFDPESGVAGVVLLAPMLRVSRRRSPVLPPAVWFRLANFVFFFSRTFESCFAPNVAAADDPCFAVTRDRFIPFLVYRNLFALIDTLAPRAPELRVPIFAALVADDRVVDTPAAQRWLDRVTAPRTVRILSDVAHDLPLECGWQKITDEIAGFIGAQGKTVIGQ